MYLCKNCGEIIDEDDLATYSESGEAWGSRYTETYRVCPNCSETSFEELTLKCDCCDDLITEKYVSTGDDHHYCEYCYQEGNIRYD